MAPSLDPDHRFKGMKLLLVGVALDDGRCMFLCGLTLPIKYSLTNSFVNNKIVFDEST